MVIIDDYISRATDGDKNSPWRIVVNNGNLLFQKQYARNKWASVATFTDN